MSNRDDESRIDDRASLELNKETLADLDVASGAAENVKGGASLVLDPLSAGPTCMKVSGLCASLGKSAPGTIADPTWSQRCL